MSDQDVLARTCWGEARNQGIIGLQAVASVVMNRVAQPEHFHFGKGSVTDCCKAPWQFSSWNENDPNLPKLLAVDDSDPIFAQCLQIAQTAIDGNLEDPTEGATYYYVKGSPEPAWAEEKTPCAIIGQHLFYKDIA